MCNLPFMECNDDMLDGWRVSWEAWDWFNDDKDACAEALRAEVKAFKEALPTTPTGEGSLEEKSIGEEVFTLLLFVGCELASIEWFIKARSEPVK